MGRSAGGSGRSSGGFGGGRSSGGFSGRGRSFGGNSTRSSSSYTSRNWGSRYGGYTSRYIGGSIMNYGYNNFSTKSIYTFILTIIFIIIIIAIISSVDPNQIKNTTQREKITGVVNKTDWYEDNIGWVGNKNTLISGLEDFYNKTGIQPYVVLIPYSQEYWNGSSIHATKADEYLESVYNSKFTDEAHFIFAYFECANDSKKEMNGEFRYLSGYSADTIMNNEAIDILWGYFETNYYNTSLSMEKMISNTFSQTAETIMSKPTNVWDFVIVAIVVIGIVVAIVVVYKILKNKHKREKEKEEYTKEILSKPLETFGTDTSDLEDKYK